MTNRTTRKPIRRKIQLVGGKTVTVSLPRNWVKKNNVGKESDQENEISMQYRPDGSLMLYPSYHIKDIERKRLHKLRKNPDLSYLKRIILADYIGGIDTIRIALKEPLDPKKHQSLQNFIDRRLIGFDMIEQDNIIEIANMMEHPKFEIDRLLERIRMQSTKMVDSCFAWIKDPSINREKLAMRMENDEVKIDRQTNQMLRTLQLSILDFWTAEKVGLPIAEVLYWSVVTRAAESAADLATSTAKLSLLSNGIDPKIADEIYELGKMVSDLYSRAMSSFIQSEYQEGYNILAVQAKNSATIQRKWPITSGDKLPVNLQLVVRNLEKIGVYAQKVAEATIDCEAAKISEKQADDWEISEF